MTGIDLIRALLAANPDSLHQEVVILPETGSAISIRSARPDQRIAFAGKELTILIPEQAPASPFSYDALRAVELEEAKRGTPVGAAPRLSDLDSPFTLIRHRDTARLDWLLDKLTWLRGVPDARATIDYEIANHPEIRTGGLR